MTLKMQWTWKRFDDLTPHELHDALALRCRFTNCGHNAEPGCAVRVALAGGELLAARFDAYRKLRAEKVASAPKERKPGALASKPSWKQRAEGVKPFRHRHHHED